MSNRLRHPWFGRRSLTAHQMNEFVEEVDTMLWTMVIVLLFLWVLGVATSHTASGFIHILYVLAMVAAVVRIILKRGVV